MKILIVDGVHRLLLLKPGELTNITITKEDDEDLEEGEEDNGGEVEFHSL